MIRHAALVVALAGCRGFLGIEEPSPRVDAAPDAPLDAAPDAPDPAQITRALIDQWSGCMTLVSFRDAAMPAKWGPFVSTQGACEACHTTGGDGFIASSQEGTYFTAISTRRAYLMQYFTVDLSDLAHAKVVINRAGLDAPGTGLPPHTNHGMYTLANTSALGSLTMFYNSTRALLANGGCQTPTLID